jgi:hypothetical protein
MGIELDHGAEYLGTRQFCTYKYKNYDPVVPSGSFRFLFLIESEQTHKTLCNHMKLFYLGRIGRTWFCIEWGGKPVKFYYEKKGKSFFVHIFYCLDKAHDCIL